MHGRLPWFTRGIPGNEAVYAGLARMQAWEQRVTALGEGRRIDCTAEKRSRSPERRHPRNSEPAMLTNAQGLRAGMEVEVMPDDTRRGGVRGIVATATRNTISILRSDARCGDVAVHFPRLGYRVTRL